MIFKIFKLEAIANFDICIFSYTNVYSVTSIVPFGNVYSLIFQEK